jgi:hypothetical protein
MTQNSAEERIPGHELSVYLHNPTLSLFRYESSLVFSTRRAEKIMRFKHYFQKVAERSALPSSALCFSLALLAYSLFLVTRASCPLATYIISHVTRASCPLATGTVTRASCPLATYILTLRLTAARASPPQRHFSLRLTAARASPPQRHFSLRLTAARASPPQRHFSLVTRASCPHATATVMLTHTHTHMLHRGLCGMAAITQLQRGGPWIPSQGCRLVRALCAHVMARLVFSARLVFTPLTARLPARLQRPRTALVSAGRTTPGLSSSGLSLVRSSAPWVALAHGGSSARVARFVGGCSARPRLLPILLPKFGWIFGSRWHEAVSHSDTLSQPRAWRWSLCEPAQKLSKRLAVIHVAVPARSCKQRARRR